MKVLEVAHSHQWMKELEAVQSHQLMRELEVIQPLAVEGAEVVQSHLEQEIGRSYQRMTRGWLITPRDKLKINQFL